MSILRSFPLLFTTPIYVATYYLYFSTVKIILPPDAYKTYSSEMEKAHKVILDYYFKKHTLLTTNCPFMWVTSQVNRCPSEGVLQSLSGYQIIGYWDDLPVSSINSGLRSIDR
ncbi:hypothetical protein ACI3L0_002097 [Candidozyma auris]|nr:hypothetical protein QG37_04020 [[Candida] auris]